MGPFRRRHPRSCDYGTIIGKGTLPRNHPKGLVRRRPHARIRWLARVANDPADAREADARAALEALERVVNRERVDEVLHRVIVRPDEPAAVVLALDEDRWRRVLAQARDQRRPRLRAQVRELRRVDARAGDV